MLFIDNITKILYNKSVKKCIIKDYMALIKCPECGKDVSDKAKACIHCGYPLQKEIQYCPYCGKENSKENSICEFCGKSFKKNNNTELVEKNVTNLNEFKKLLTYLLYEDDKLSMDDEKKYLYIHIKNANSNV